MSSQQMAVLQIDLEELAAKRGLRLKETPSMTHGPAGIDVRPSGSALWTIYDASGSPTGEFCVMFQPREQ